MDLTLYTLSRSASLWSARAHLPGTRTLLFYLMLALGPVLIWFFPLTILPH